MRIIGFDTETDLIRPGTNAPELACLSYAELGEHSGRVVSAQEGIKLFASWLRDPEVLLVAHNAAYDVAVLFAAAPYLKKDIQKLYNSDRIHCTQKRGELLDIAEGHFRGRWNGDGTKTRWGYTLSELHARAGFGHLAKDRYRMSYGIFRWFPIETWDPEAIEYSALDSDAPLRVWEHQERHPLRATLRNQGEQCRKALAQELMSCWGMRTREEPVEALRIQVEGEIDRLKKELVPTGLVKPDGSRSLKEATRALVAAWADQARDGEDVRPRLTPTGVKAVLDATGKKTIESIPKDAYWKAITSLSSGVGLDENACEGAGTELLKNYAAYSKWLKVLSTDVPLLQKGIRFPIHASYGLVESGRSSCFAPNLQNLRGLPGIRECFYPRDGWVYANADYDQLELRTLAQVCIALFGFSRLAEALNRGLDPHTILGCALAGINPDGVDKDDPRIGKFRKLAKVANFGFPGGMGWKKIRTYAANKPYRLRISADEALSLRNTWMGTWTEVPRLFAQTSEQLESGGGYATISQLFSGRLRRSDRYAAINNTWFQGLGADATGRAMWLICEGCYFNEESPLYGCRLVNYVHDEFILEAPITRGPEAAAELARLMKVGADQYLPDVPSKTEPLLMPYWSKDAKRVEDQDGVLTVWEMEEAA